MLKRFFFVLFFLGLFLTLFHTSKEAKKKREKNCVSNFLMLSLFLDALSILDALSFFSFYRFPHSAEHWCVSLCTVVLSPNAVIYTIHILILLNAVYILYTSSYYCIQYPFACSTTVQKEKKARQHSSAKHSSAKC